MSSTTASTSQASSGNNFRLICDAALAEYIKKTGVDLTKHPSAEKLQNCHSADAVLDLLQENAEQFKDYRDQNRTLINCLKPVVQTVHAFSNILGEVANLVPFQPTSAIFVGLDVLLGAAVAVTESYDALIDLFECVSNFLGRLRIYAEMPTISDMVVKIMVEVLSVLALATKQIKQGRFKKFAKKLLGESEIEAVRQRLDRLTDDEARMTVAQTLQVVHGLVNNMKVVMDDGKASTSEMRHALVTMQEMTNKINKINRDQLQRDTRSWLSPPDTSTNHNIAWDVHQDGSAAWFMKSSTFEEWKSTGSLLWIHGKPGSGKSILCSSIIEEIKEKCDSGLALLNYYYFDFKDVAKQDVRGLVASLLAQLCAKSDPCYDILSELYSKNNAGSQQPSNHALTECLKKMLRLPRQPTIYIIVDALDECPNTSGIPNTAREKVLDLLEELVELKLPHLHICLTSRPEIDIGNVLEPLTAFQISLHDESGQKKAILDYITTIVLTDRKMRRWRPEDKQLVIDTLSAKADGMFRWVICQLDMLRGCFPASLRDTLDDLPETLDETYQRILLGIEKGKREYAHRLLQCLVVSVRPLHVEELAEVLAMRFDRGSLPRYHANWKLEDSREAVLLACSSLVVIANVDRSPIVQFAHFSVKEYLTSDRLAEATSNLSYYRINSRSAHTTLAQASLSVLLHLGDWVDREKMKEFPFAFYAAEHWVVHGQFEDVSSRIQDSMERLFDTDNPSFATWIWIYDIDLPHRIHMFTRHPTRPEVAPLYYATLCGFRGLVEHLLLTTNPGDIIARGGYHTTPLHAALAKQNFEIAELLLGHGAGVDFLNSGGLSALHKASESGRLDTVEFLLDHHAGVNRKAKDGKSPLAFASWMGELKVARILLRHKATVDSTDNEGWTPLFMASRYGHLGIVQLLIESGAAVNSRQNDGQTPLYAASRYGHLDVVRLLIERGAAVHSRQNDGWTPLFAASRYGHLDVVRLLFENGAAVDSRENDGWTPLFVASRYGHLDMVRLLIESGAAVDSRENDGWTPLYATSLYGHLDIVRLLIERGAAVDSRENDGRTPIFAASLHGHLDIVRLLIESGAAVDSRENDGWTPLMSASLFGHLDIVQELLNQSADVNVQQADLHTPLHLASANGHARVAALLIQCCARVDKQTKAGETPLHQASSNGHLEIAQSLLNSGSNPNAQDSTGLTPLHTAASNGLLNIVKLLLELGADVNVRDSNHMTPFDLASTNGKRDVAMLLGDRMGRLVSWDDTPPTHMDLGCEDPLPSVVVSSHDRKEPVDAPRSERPSLHTASKEGSLVVLRSLLGNGTDVNERNAGHETPLIVASVNGKLEVARVLIKNGADVNSRDKTGWTPLHCASRFGHADIVRLLLDYGADVDAKKHGDWSALHLASVNGHIEIVKLLLERGANVEMMNDEGRTPSDEARRRGEVEIVGLLSRCSACRT